ncbi:hypothetical protein AB834_00230 [PVC group bacterium (ex Bugula neritina AB1)]|nr:hypothetical protein AB834_00230 [PVC group bacterium (ex Bugula neritina AB1)]
MAIYLKSNSKTSYLGASIEFNEDDMAVISEYTKKGTPAYNAGLEKGDIIIAINNQSFSDIDQFNAALQKHKPGKKVTIMYKRLNVENKVLVKIAPDPEIKVTPYSKPSKKALEKREKWLKAKE